MTKMSFGQKIENFPENREQKKKDIIYELNSMDFINFIFPFLS